MPSIFAMRAGLLEKSSASCYNGKENFWKGGVRLEKIRLAAARCIKGRLQPPCRACEDVCPVGAFRWGVPHPDLCIDCGLCTAVCPAAAVETRLDYAAKLTAVVAADAPSVRLACAKSAPDSMLPCLGFLTRGILWVIASKREVQLDIGACRACLPAVHAHLVREAAAVDAALAAAGRAPLRLLDAEPAAREYSRRDFFRRFRDVAKEKFGQGDAAGGAGGSAAAGAHDVGLVERMAGGAVAGECAGAASAEADDVLPPDAAGMEQASVRPALAAFSASAWAFAHGAQPAAVHADLVAFNPAAWAFACGAPPAAVHADIALYSGCNACGFCARLCPHGALRASVEGEDFVLTFMPQLCTACGLCTARCPKSALRLAASPAAKRWRIPLPRCESCGAPFQPIGASKVCRACMEG